MTRPDKITLIKDRIKALIPRNPNILTMTTGGSLVFVRGFNVTDLDPTFSEVNTALFQAIEEYRREQEASV